jgi:hypothetical protein
MSIVDERFEAYFRAARKQDLLVLVWGPGDPGPGGDPKIALYWRKRNEIRAAVKARFPNAEVLFSESAVLRDYTRHLGDLLTEELAHADIADCILILDVSRGASLELDHFSADPLIARKMRLLIPAEHVGGTGLISSVHDKVRVSGFTDDDLASCRVATKIVPDLVDAVAIEKMQASRLRGVV